MSRGRDYTIIGVVATTTSEAFGEAPTPVVYYAYRDRVPIAGEVHLRAKPGGLSPFDVVQQSLQAVRRGDARVVAGEFPDEVQPVVTELNALLAHQQEAVARAQASAGDLAHGLKTPLAILLQEAERAEAQGQTTLAHTLRQQLARMERQVDAHLARARAAASGATLDARANVADVIAGLTRTVERLYADRALAIRTDIAPALHVRVQAQDLEEVLGNVLDNACKWARTAIAVTAHAQGTTVTVLVDDDGAGLAPAMRVAVLERGVRADETAPGTGLGLAIAKDIAGLYGGTITLDTSPTGGLRVAITLPAA